MIGCLPPRVNPDTVRLRLPSSAATHCHATASSDHLSAREPRTTSHAPLPLRNRCFPFLSSPLTIDHFSSTISSPLPHPPYKRRREPHNSSAQPFSAFLWVSLVQELTLTGAQVAAATTPHRPMAFVVLRPDLRLVRSPESPSSSPSIHVELPCITTTAHLNSSEFLSSQVHHESNGSHSIESLHPIHVISLTKINPNFRKKFKTLHEHHYLFGKFFSNLYE
jgi:hypothetical protein